MITQIIILIVLILLNAYFAATEIAFISLNKTKIEKQANEGNKKARKIEKIIKNNIENIIIDKIINNIHDITISSILIKE